MELLEPLRRPLLSLFICRALEGKEPLPIRRNDIMAAWVALLMAQRPREKKIIVAEIAKKFDCSEHHVRHCHEKMVKADKAFQKLLEDTQEYTNSVLQGRPIKLNPNP